MNDDDDPIRRIEAELERNRADLARALGALRSGLTLDAVWRGGSEAMRAGAVPGVKAAGALARDNPAVLAAVGAGLGWILTRAGKGRRADVPPAPDSRLADLFVPGGRAAPSADELWMAEADHLRRRAADLLETIDQAIAAGAAPDHELLERRAEVVAALAQDVRRVMARGLEEMAEPDRARAFAARERAYARHLGVDPGRDWLRPALAGTAIAGAGIALAWMLPRSGTEDALFGSLRDRLAEEAEGLAGSDNRLAGLIGQVLMGLTGSGRAEEDGPEGE